jgi:hypothetical protein
MILSSTFFAVLIALESHGNRLAVGDSHRSLGVLQIQSAVITDVNRIYGYRFDHQDAYDVTSSKVILASYLNHYCTKERLGREPTEEDAARIWNGGPDGWRKRATLPYLKKYRDYRKKIS